MFYENKELVPNEILENILDSVSDIIAVYKSDTRLIMINQKALDFFQVDASQYLNSTPSEQVESGLIGNSIISKVINSKQEVSDIIHTPKGDLMSRCRPILDKKGYVKLVVATASPTDEINELQIKLAREQYENSKYQREIEYLRDTLFHHEDFIFESNDMKQLLEVVKKVAPVDCNVLITGESGVGKDLLAKIVHVNSSRDGGPFVPVNIAAIPETLLEAELFGYEKGAFTGANKDGKIGLFEVAQGGTLFLDEVGDMPYPTQVKLLRAIENGEITRVGSTKTVQVNIRIISATNKDLGRAVINGTFREDLYYRLAVFPLNIKPLRDRQYDIIPLSKYFINKFNHKYKLNKYLSESSLTCLVNYSWPGNVRELRNVVERVVILSNNDLITEADINKMVNVATFRQEQPNCTTASNSVFKDYEIYERDKILEALKTCSGNKTKTAQLLGMNRSKLYRKLKHYSV